MRFMASAILNLLLLLPFVIGRYAGTPMRSLHPLVLPTLLVIAKDLTKSPDSLLLPVLAWFLPPDASRLRTAAGYATCRHARR